MSEVIQESEVRNTVAAFVDAATGLAIGFHQNGIDCVRGVGIDGANVALEILLPYPVADRREQLSQDIAAFIKEHLPAVEQVMVNLSWRVRTHKVQDKQTPIPGIKNIIVVGSGKGGVGKSTVTANLALSLRKLGASVGVLDADIHGPSQPRMFGLEGQPDITEDKKIIPMENHGIKVMSIGLLLGDDAPAVWRGPMVSSALQQLLTQTDWGHLDYLVIDLPPGTGDIQLTLAQKVPVSGAVIVTTPQEVALLDARRAVMMFRKVGITTLGVVENMSTFACPKCGHEEAIFDQGGGAQMAKDYELPLLGQLPLHSSIRAGTDEGQPSVVADAESAQSQRFIEIAARSSALLSRQALGVQSTGVKLSIKT